MSTLLGIDTGGTYTDAVVVDEERGVIASAKALTTRHDLTLGIARVIESVRSGSAREIHLVSLSTTLATNAIVEGLGSPVCLLLLGYDPDMVEGSEFESLRRKNPIVFVKGGHTIRGEEQSPLDIKTLRREILAHAPSVTAFAISGYFSVMNTEHELKAKRMVRELTGLPVSCGHELTSHLNAPARAVTAALNARLISLMHELILALKQVMMKYRIHAPLMIVKGDGSLMNAETALERPVETIMSGPAASVVGAQYLCDCEDALVIDMGGTTTDIALLSGGMPIINESGSSVGNFRTMVTSVDARTSGLGGDSAVSFNQQGRLTLGPRRAIPLCMLAQSYPGVMQALQKQFDAGGKTGNDLKARFVLIHNSGAGNLSGLTAMHKEILESLNDGPVSVLELAGKAKYVSICVSCIEDLIERGLIVSSSFTPTDAVNVLELYHCGNEQASYLAASIGSNYLGIKPEQFCQRIFDMVKKQLSGELLRSAMYADGILDAFHDDTLNALLMEKALDRKENDSFDVSISLKRPLVALGAPVGTYMPGVASVLKARLQIPENAHVANAVGAVAGGVLQRVRILIKPISGGLFYRVHMSEEVRDFNRYDKALDYARSRAHRIAGEHARRAGACEVEIHIATHEHKIAGNTEGAVSDVLIETEVVATAMGRPQMGNAYV